MSLREISVVVAAGLLIAACGSGETSAPSDSTRDQQGSFPTAAQHHPEPPPAPSTVGKVEIQLTIESQQGSWTVIRSQLANRSEAPASDGRFQIVQRWESGQWVNASVLPHASSPSRVVRACDPANLEGCETSAEEPLDVEPGELGQVRRVAVYALEAGTHRVIEPIDIREPEFRPDPRVVSRYFDIGASEPVITIDEPGTDQSNDELIPMGSTAPTVEHAASAEDEPDSGAGVDGPLMYAAARSDTGDAMAALIIGTLELDGDCLYTTFDGNRYPVLWPHGTTWDETTSSVVLANGTPLALGSELDGGGGYMNIEVFSDVLDNDSVVELARRCAEEPSFEIAVMN